MSRLVLIDLHSCTDVKRYLGLGLGLFQERSSYECDILNTQNLDSDLFGDCYSLFTVHSFILVQFSRVCSVFERCRGDIAYFKVMSVTVQQALCTWYRLPLTLR